MKHLNVNIRITNHCLRRDVCTNNFCNKEHIVWGNICSKILKKKKQTWWFSLSFWTVKNFHFFSPQSFLFSTVPRGMWNLSSLTRDGPYAPCSRSMESWPLDHQGNLSPQSFERETPRMPFLTHSFQSAHRQLSFLELRCSQLPSGLWLSAHSLSVSVSLFLEETIKEQERPFWLHSP